MSTSSPLGHHLILRLRDDRVIAPDVPSRRALACAVLAHGRDAGLLAFRASDTHLHLLTLADAASSGRLAHAVELSLRHRLKLKVAWEAARVRPVADQKHLHNAFLYIHRQAEHHALAEDGLHDASSLPDLLGLRVMGTFLLERARERLPRVARADLLACLGIQRLERAVELAFLADSAAAALATIAPKPRSEDAARAWSAAVHAVGDAVSTEAVAAAIGVSPRYVRALRGSEPEQALVHAIGLQMGLRRALGLTCEAMSALERADRHTTA